MPQQKRSNIIKIAIFNIVTILISFLCMYATPDGVFAFHGIYTILSVIMIFLIGFMAIAFRRRLLDYTYKIPTVLIGFCLSYLMLVVTQNKPGLPFWIIGSIATAAFVDAGLGVYLGYFLILQIAQNGQTDFTLYVIHVICLSVICVLISRIVTYKEIVYLDTVSTCVMLVIFIIGKIVNVSGVQETTLFFIILTYITLITFIGLMKLSFGKILNKNTEAESLKVDNSNGFAYLNDMASDLNKMEKLDTAVENSLEAILDAEINDLKVSDIEPITDYQVPEGLSPKRQPDVDYNQFIEEHRELLQRLKSISKQQYIQSMRVAALSEESAKSININHYLTKAIGSFYLLNALMPEESADSYNDFLASLEFPENVTHAICEVSYALGKNTGKASGFGLDEYSSLTSKEAALVYITAKISATFFFLKASKKSIDVEKIVDMAMGSDITKGVFNNSGMTLKDCSELRHFFVDKLNSLN